MTENIDKMLQRGEKLELLEERTDHLVFEASTAQASHLHTVSATHCQLTACISCAAGRPVCADRQDITAADVVAELQDEAGPGWCSAALGSGGLPACVLQRG